VDCELRHLRNGVRDCRVQNLFVIARTSSFTYKGKAVDVKWVGRELDVRYVLEGSVRKAGNRVRITGQLINTQLPGTAASGAEQPFARWPVLGAWLRGLNDRREK
jgi:hypothetical protein